MYKIKSFAKINLGLEVLSKRNDNFHSIKTVISKISLFDEIQIEKSDFNSVKQLGIKEDENLVTKILLHMQKKYFTEKISIRIKKKYSIFLWFRWGFFKFCLCNQRLK